MKLITPTQLKSVANSILNKIKETAGIADNAVSLSTQAKTAATKAQQTADTAKTAADAASETASAAQSTANSAKSAAETGLSKANSVQESLITLQDIVSSDFHHITIISDRVQKITFKSLSSNLSDYPDINISLHPGVNLVKINPGCLKKWTLCNLTGELSFDFAFSPYLAGIDLSRLNVYSQDLESLTIRRLYAETTSLASAFPKGIKVIHFIDCELNVTNMNNACYGCSNLKEFTAPYINCANWGQAFSGCTSLKKVNLYQGKATSTIQDMLAGCTSLEEAYLPDLESISTAQRLFNSNDSLSIIGCSDVCKKRLITASSITGLPAKFKNEIYEGWQTSPYTWT